MLRDRLWDIFAGSICEEGGWVKGNEIHMYVNGSRREHD
jgi:hypothetical protein